MKNYLKTTKQRLTKNNYIMKNQLRTPIEKVLFRSSKIGSLAGGLLSNDLTENQRQEIEQLEALKTTPIGLTEKQQAQLKDWDEKVNSGSTLTPKQMESRDDYKSRLVTPKGLTPRQAERLAELIEKDNAAPELSKGAKTYIKDVWLWNEKKFKEDIQTNKTRKGTQAEEDGVNLISFVDGIMYINNNLLPDKGRLTDGHLTGAADVIHFKTDTVHDIKCSWNPKTFMSAKLTTEYEWQLRAYMFLYNVDNAKLRYCLVDCPPEVYEDEYKKFCWSHNIIDDTLEEYQPIINQFKSNYLYEYSGLYTQEERVKTFEITRDKELESVMLESISLGLDYYKTITLNMID